MTEFKDLNSHVILPTQFFRKVPDSPERRLMLAVLEDAVVTYLKYKSGNSRKDLRLVQETKEWFSSSDTWIFSFETICAVLDIDAEAFRKALFCKESSRAQNKGGKKHAA